MPILIRLALKNLAAHRGKSFIIGTIIAVGVIVLIVGNALMDTAALGIQRAFIDNYTGHIMISGTSEGTVSLFGVQTVGGIDPTPLIPDFPEVYAQASAVPGLVSLTPQLSGFGLLRKEFGDSAPDAEGSAEDSTFTLLFGIDPESYPQTFSNFNIVEGRLLRPGETGILISESRREDLYEDYLDSLEEESTDQVSSALGAPDPSAVPEETTADDQPDETADEDAGFSEEELQAFLSPGDELRILGGFNQGLPRIRVLPVVGVYRESNQAEGVGSDLITFIDGQSLRAILNLNLGSSDEVELTDDQTRLLRGLAAADSQTEIFGDALFGNPDVGIGVVESSELDFEFADPFALPEEVDAAASPDALPAPSQESSARMENHPFNSASWHYLLLRLEDGRRADSVIRNLNAAFEAEGIDAVAGNWEKAAGPFAETADVIRTVFNIAIIIIGVVAILIMMNTMVISVIERTSEIGTMRALGAQRNTIRALFLWETLALTFIFGALGVVLGMVITGVLNLVGIEATNTFLQVLFAGPVLRPRIVPISILYSLAIVVGIGIVAHLYPVSVAVKIAPVKAMQSE